MKSFMDDFKSALLKEVKDEIKTNVKSQIIPVVRKISEVEKKVIEHDKKFETYDYERRKRNILIFRVPESDNETFKSLEENVLNIFNQMLQVKCNTEEIDYIVRVGRKNGDKVRPILVRMVAYRKKLELLRNRGYLKGKTVSIDEDYSPEVRQKRKALLPELKALRSQGMKAQIRQDRIVIRDANMGSDQSQQSGGQNYDWVSRNKRLLSPGVPESPNTKKFMQVSNPGNSGISSPSPMRAAGTGSSSSLLDLTLVNTEEVEYQDVNMFEEAE